MITNHHPSKQKFATMLRALALSIVALSATSAQAKTYKVLIQNMKFVPDALEVGVGDTVVWINEDIVPHTATVTKGAQKFDSGLIAAGKSYKLTAKTKGDSAYFCSYHPTMKAKLVVK